MRKITTILAILCLAPLVAFASESTVKLDQAPIRSGDKLSLQRGAQTFVNYCLSCHSAEYMRYNRLRDLGLSENQISDNLIFTGQKVGELMTVAMKTKEAKQWFGVAPPDLSVIARSRGADWLYTYLRKFYRDDSTATGWNNLVFDKAAMPHVLYQLQGEQSLVTNTVDDGHGGTHEVKELKLDKPGTLSKTEYEAYVADLVNFLVYLGEPAATKRVQIGIIVMLFLFGMLALTYALKHEYWKDIH
ncbi:ubiquinol-cytochrome c reductase cytochrome c1 subunit [Nitrosospira sp. Nsp11]|jgi:ubiquinol-cytochrome c reductase cytochrome c1 subunit|uniref:cytochrome c1 n=1 Tax=Nitrosospira sp. Nsp11 TaxID=1855338 RepID=UPI00091EEC27|nr:cytochrome c1 [Nitrosospira sp. Nsp11]SHL61247.1 ubiquinol-cytochrome c reductase cytochrome c1 subunit [Nitrosospira sp. Nsp11]